MRLGTWCYQSPDETQGCLVQLYHLFKTRYSAVITHGFDLSSPTATPSLESHCEISDQSEADARQLAENWIRSNLFGSWLPPMALCDECGKELNDTTLNVCPRCGAKFKDFQ